MDARLDSVHAACQTAAAHAQTCATIGARLAAERDDLQRCLSEQPKQRQRRWLAAPLRDGFTA
ncbi:hypothetical protein [Xanthomonas campestris]|nr:hypothetical protein [Xanthomonas campestris]